LWPRALFLPLAFLPFRRGLFREARWARWGSLAAFLLLSAATRVWLHFQWNGLEFYDWFLGKHFAVFGVFVLLGWAAFPVRGTQRSVPLGVGLLALGFLLLAAQPVGRTPGPAGLGWLLIWGAGFGFESLRRDLLDASWHGRAVWAAAGLAAFGGVF
ncbi:MAG TPA: hypothetical protein VFR02_08255, partial [bacterium]|nr:hypothetical protein [bacterium]